MRRLAIIPSGGANWEVFYRPEKIFVIEVLVVLDEPYLIVVYS